MPFPRSLSRLAMSTHFSNCYCPAKPTRTREPDVSLIRAQHGSSSHRHYHFHHTLYSPRYGLSQFMVDELQAIW